MKRHIIIFCWLLFSASGFPQHTFSIVAVDPATGEVGAAGASCISGAASIGGVKIINTLIPGRGGVNAQAWICVNPHINLNNAVAQMSIGRSPEEIINWLSINDDCSAQNYNAAFRQYGIVDFDPDGKVRAAAFTGTMADDYKGHIVGDTYAIQGNILLGPEVLKGMEFGFTTTEGSLAQKLMAAMQGANIPGADARCLSRGTTSTSAFLRVAKADDVANALSLELNIPEVSFGQEPIDALQRLFDERFPTALHHTPSPFRHLQVFPNPASEAILVEMPDVSLKQMAIINQLGQLVWSQQAIGPGQFSIDISALPRGLFWLRAKDQQHQKYLGKFIKL